MQWHWFQRVVNCHHVLVLIVTFILAISTPATMRTRWKRSKGTDKLNLRGSGARVWEQEGEFSQQKKKRVMQRA